MAIFLLYPHGGEYESALGGLFYKDSDVIHERITPSSSLPKALTS